MTDMTNLMEAPEVSIPSLSSSCMLVELSISVWGATRTDKEAKEKLDAITNADETIYRVSASLTGKDPELDVIRKYAAGVRTNILYHHTQPWADTGPRLLTTGRYFTFHNQITGAQATFGTMVEDYIATFDTRVDTILANNPTSTLHRSDFPTTNELRRKFGFRVNYMPMPESGDFRLDIANDAARELQATYADFYARKTVEAMNDVWQRAHKALTHTAERLADPDADFKGTVTKDGRKKFSDDLLENLRDMLDLMKACNITGDEKMQRIERNLSDALLGVTTEAVKEDPHLRRDTKAEIDKAIANLPSLDW